MSGRPVIMWHIDSNLDDQPVGSEVVGGSTDGHAGKMILYVKFFINSV
jgi:hypothetical protein